MQRRRDYQSLDDMAREEGVVSVLKFLSHNPTMIDGVYRHTNMKIVPFTVKEVFPVIPQQAKDYSNYIMRED